MEVFVSEVPLSLTHSFSLLLSFKKDNGRLKTNNFIPNVLSVNSKHNAPRWFQSNWPPQLDLYCVFSRTRQQNIEHCQVFKQNSAVWIFLVRRKPHTCACCLELWIDKTQMCG